MRSLFRFLAIVPLLMLVNQDPQLNVAGNPASAQEPPAASTQDLRAWLQQFPVPNSEVQDIAIGRLFLKGEEIRPFSGQSISGLGINGLVQFTSERGLARMVLVDDQLQEHLVYETYPLIAGGASVEIRNACRETCLLSPTVPSVLKVELVDASLQIQSIVINRLMTAAARAAPATAATQSTQQVKQAQESEIVKLLNKQIKARGLKWIAGETAISRLSYAEKKRILPCATATPDVVPNLQGAEYYKGGILEIAPGAASVSAPVGEASTVVDAFDWRSRHGANRPGSPYYDGDQTGSGWMTSIKLQRCADCWAHSALGATEALVNLYFNQHVDVNLSEQELVSCSGAGSCRYGGHTGAALAYVARAGVVDETCFPESGIDEPCNLCPLPRERIQITGYADVNPWDGEENIKRRLITWGPLPFGVASWWHALVLTGYYRETDTGETVWIIKNSWGPDWGEHGYAYMKVPLWDIYLTYYLFPPVLSLIAPYTVACTDADGDGYFNWGISRDMPLTCGNARPEKDCDDSDPALAVMTDDGFCTAPPDTTAPVITTAATPSTLWPPNGRMREVVVSGTITDADSGVNAGTATYAAGDEYGLVQSGGPIPIASDGSYKVTVWLEASRRGDDYDGRHYVITIAAQDRAGNSGSSASVVTVPHDMGLGSGATRKGR